MNIGIFSLKLWWLFWGNDLEGLIYTYLKRIWNKPWYLKVWKYVTTIFKLLPMVLIFQEIAIYLSYLMTEKNSILTTLTQTKTLQKSSPMTVPMILKQPPMIKLKSNCQTPRKLHAQFVSKLLLTRKLSWITTLMFVWTVKLLIVSPKRMRRTGKKSNY